MSRPGGPYARRPLHFVWIADCSSSMSAGGKIQSLNNAVREALPTMRRVAQENPNAELLIRVLAFSDGARWEVENPTGIDGFRWPDLRADGLTDLGAALEALADGLQPDRVPARALPPVLVLLSDGYPSDEWEPGLRRLMEQPWGAHAVRIGVGIGQGANLEVLKRFIGDPRIPPLSARNADELAHYIRWASTAVVSWTSAPKTDGSAANSPLVSLPGPAPVAAADMTW